MGFLDGKEAARELRESFWALPEGGCLLTPERKNEVIGGGRAGQEE